MAENQRRDWSRIPSDLLQEIAGHLAEIVDRIRFRGVCVQWRSIAIPKNTHQQLPWLLPLDAAHRENYKKDGKLRFLSLTENRTYVVPLPEFCNHQIFTSSHGWLIAVAEEGVHEENIEFCISLVNPLTRATISLPPLLSSLEEQLFPLDLGSNVKLLELESDLVVFVSDEGWPGIFFWRRGETAWSKLYSAVRHSWYADYLLHKGRLFACDRNTSETEVFDMNTFKMVSTILPAWDSNEDYCYNLFESPHGELLLVLRELSMEDKGFHLFRLDEGGRQRKWVTVTSIGDYSLLETPLHAICFASSHFEGYRGNCIYFLDDTSDDEEEDSCVRLFDIGESRIEQALSLNSPQRKLFSAELFIPSLC